MAVSGVQSLGTTATASAGTNRMADAVSSEDFLKLMITELTNQDPLNPMDNKELLSQLSEIRNMESSMQLTDTLKQMLTQSQMGSASSLIGKMIEGKDAFGVEVKGVVDSLKVENGQVSLMVNGTTVPFEGVFKVEEAPDGYKAAANVGLPGDMNGDGYHDQADLDAMREAILDPAAWQEKTGKDPSAYGDISGPDGVRDGVFSWLDIARMEEALIASAKEE